MKYAAVVIGVSAGGMNALGQILPMLPEDFPLPIIIVQHISPHSDNYMIRHFNNLSRITVKEADEKEQIKAGTACFAPPNYHLLVEENKTFSLSTEGRVNFSRPSVDVLFDSASDAYGDTLIGIILTGANNDGSKGLKKISDCGGLAIVQDPESAEVPAMPEAAIKLIKNSKILKLNEIAPYLIKISKNP